MEETGCGQTAAVAEVSVGQVLYHDHDLSCCFHCMSISRLDDPRCKLMGGMQDVFLYGIVRRDHVDVLAVLVPYGVLRLYL